MVLHLFKDVLGDETIKIISEYGAFAEPLPIDFAPCRLRPAGIGDGEVQAVLVYHMPKTSRGDMAEGVSKVVQNHLGIARRAGSEEHKHVIIAACIGTGEVFVSRFNKGIEIEEIAAFGCDIILSVRGASKHYTLNCGALGESFEDVFGGLVIGGCDNSLYLRRIEAIGEILFKKLVRCGDNNRAELMDCEDGVPELVVAAHSKENLVALADAHG